MKDFPDAGGTQQAFDRPTEAKVGDGDLRLLSRLDLLGQEEVTGEQAAFNRAMSKGPVRPRPAIRGLLSISEASFDRLLRNGQFPAPLMLGPRLPRWPVHTVRQWLAGRTSRPDTETTEEPKE
jgi:predicted DNA-binding transcriptional regulator AlpA